jgi:hypothetical protein
MQTGFAYGNNKLFDKPGAMRYSTASDWETDSLLIKRQRTIRQKGSGSCILRVNTALSSRIIYQRVFLIPDIIFNFISLRSIQA